MCRFCASGVQNTLIALALSVPLVATAQVKYAVSGNTAYVTQSPNATGNIVIVSSFEGEPVTAIAQNAFFGCGGLTDVTIPSSVTGIGDGAFSGCTSLTNFVVDAGNPTYSTLGGVLFDTVQDALIQYPAGLTNDSYVIPDGVSSLGDYAFEYCGSLTSISIPNSITNMGVAVFEDCGNLTNISVDASSQTYSTLNNILFDKGQGTLVAYPTGLANNPYIIPNTVTNIEQYAFEDCTKVDGIVIPDSMTSIGQYAFEGCSSLTKVTIPNSVTSFGLDAFAACDGLTNFTIPNGVTDVGIGAFSGCFYLTNVIVPISVTNIELGVFSTCPKLKSVYFLGNSPAIGSDVFYDDAPTVYYLPGTTGWGSTYGGSPTVPWFQPQPIVLTFEPSFGMQNNQFGFPISWATNASVIVQACTNLSNAVWTPIATNALSNGTYYFSDPSWISYPGRFYRVVSQ